MKLSRNEFFQKRLANKIDRRARHGETERNQLVMPVFRFELKSYSQ